jgi:hypothetical protein
VILTALAAILGMIPLAGSIFWGPMAITIMGGLLVATALTLLVVPALYALCFRLRSDETARWRLARDRKVLKDLLARLALRAQSGRPAPRAIKASKGPSVPRAQSESRARLVLRDHQGQSARKARREKRVGKVRSAPPASADHQGLKAPLGRPAQPDQLARRVSPVQHRQFASSPVPIALAAETTKSWPVSSARAVRPTERSARPLERQPPVYAHVGDLIGSLAPGARQLRRKQIWQRQRLAAHERVRAGQAQRLARDRQRRVRHGGVTFGGGMNGAAVDRRE